MKLLLLVIFTVLILGIVEETYGYSVGLAGQLTSLPLPFLQYGIIRERRVPLVWILLIMIMALMYSTLVIVSREPLKNKKNPSNPFKKLGKTIQKKVINPVKKLVSKPKPKPKAKPYILPVPVEFASYADNVINPSNDDNDENIRKDNVEYQKALDGKPSDKIVSKNPLGSLYFQSTGTKCNTSEGKLVDRYIVVDSLAQGDLLNSADADFNKSVAPFNILDYKTTLANKCSPVTITPVDVYGRQMAKQTRYV